MKANLRQKPLMRNRLVTLSLLLMRLIAEPRRLATLKTFTCRPRGSIGTESVVINSSRTLTEADQSGIVQDAVADGRPDAPRSFIPQLLRRGHKRARRFRDVIDDKDVASFHLADNSDRLDGVRGLAFFWPRSKVRRRGLLHRPRPFSSLRRRES